MRSLRSALNATVGSLRVLWRVASDHSAGINAITTVVLALFAYMSLQEVKAQRQQLYDQMRLANRPFLVFHAPEVFALSAERASTSWNVLNVGGPVGEVNLRFVVAGLSKPLEQMQKGNQIYSQAWNHRVSGIARKHYNTSFLGVSDSTREWLEDALRESDVRVVAFAVARFNSPAFALGGADRREVITASYHWNSNFSKWMDLTPKGHEIVKSLLVDQGVLDAERWELDLEPRIEAPLLSN